MRSVRSKKMPPRPADCVYGKTREIKPGASVSEICGRVGGVRGRGRRAPREDGRGAVIYRRGPSSLFPKMASAGSSRFYAPLSAGRKPPPRPTCYWADRSGGEGVPYPAPFLTIIQCFLTAGELPLKSKKTQRADKSAYSDSGSGVYFILCTCISSTGKNAVNIQRMLK